MDDNSLITLFNLIALLLVVWLIVGAGMGFVQRFDISIEQINAAIVVCEANGGLASVDSIVATCTNGATFEGYIE